ncbi:MAG: arylsulfatase, partial [Proteobacteria bacterium]|nr:arylsulfatase [Pseudomonadota bacterium]
INLLFSTDRGLRDGAWKAVSFRREAWELYNIAKDRTELKNLAESEPKRLDAMIETWNDMTKNVLHAGPKFYAPVTQATLPHRHPQWTNFEGRAPGKVVKKNRSRQNRPVKNAIRARKNTQLTSADGVLQLRFTGDDPGIATDLRGRKLPAGPYRLRFRLLGGGRGGGEVFYTTEPKVTLPRGARIEFDIRADGQWQDVMIELPTEKSILLLRLDVSPGPGKATIADLQLENATGQVIVSWPQVKQ